MMEPSSAEIRQALKQADQALTSAEEVLDNLKRATEALSLAQQAAVSLLRAFLLFRGEEPAGENSLRKLWDQCVSIEAEFLELQETVEYLLPETPLEDLDIEDLSEILDAANEVWDFVVGYFPENCLP